MDDKKCKQAKCSCKANDTKADGFCSKECKEGKTEGGKCSCGHSTCH